MPGLGIRGGVLGDSWGGCSLVPTFSQLKLQGGERPAQTSLVPDLPVPPAHTLSSTATPRSLHEGREMRKTKTDASSLG